MSVDRAGVVEAEFLEHCRGRDHALGMFFHPFGDFHEGWRGRKNFFGRLLGVGVKTSRHQLGQIIIERTDAFRNRHVVVVQNDDHILATDIVHRFEGHASGDGTVADDSHSLALGSAQARCHRHAKGGGNGSRRVGGAEGVVNTFFTARESGNTTLLAQFRHARFATGEDFVTISLMSDIPHQPIIRRVEHVMQCNRQFDRSEVRRKMAARRGYRFNNEFAQLLCQWQKLAPIQPAQIGRVLNPIEQRVFVHEFVSSSSGVAVR